MRKESEMPEDNVNAADKKVGAVEDKSPTCSEGIYSAHLYEDMALRRAICRLFDSTDQNVLLAVRIPTLQTRPLPKYQCDNIGIASTIIVGDDDGIPDDR